MLSLLTLWDTNFWPTQQPASINQDCTLCNTLSTYILRATCWSTLEQQASKHHRNDRNFEHVTGIKPLPFSIRRLIIPSVRDKHRLNRSMDMDIFIKFRRVKRMINRGEGYCHGLYYGRVVNAPIHGTLSVWGTGRDWRKKRARAAWEHIGNAERMSKWNV